MRYEIQVHFENCGQLAWHEEITDAQDWLGGLCEQDNCLVHDEETGRHMYFAMKPVTAIILAPKQSDQDDLFRRAYATKDGEEQESNRLQHQRDAIQWPSQESSNSCCSQPSPKSWC